MNTKIIRISDARKDYAKIKQAADVLRDGGLAALPTETVYGIAANALDALAVAKIFKVKGRPADNPLIVHIAELADIDPLVTDFPEQAEALAKAFWPGPLTIILPKSDQIPEIVSAKLPTVAVRMPSHPVIRAIIKESGLPLAAPSANLSGKPSPTSAKHCIDDLNCKVDLIIDGGDCNIGVESTVISLTTPIPRLLRPGMITPEQLEAVLGAVEVDLAVTSALKQNAAAASPGMKYKHYAPRAKVTLVHGDFKSFARYISARPGSYALVFDGEDKRLTAPCVCYGAKADHAGQAKRLFAALREFDEICAGQVYVRAPDMSGVGLAVYNRLIRAAAFNEIFL